jgi:hypothetical protein
MTNAAPMHGFFLQNNALMITLALVLPMHARCQSLSSQCVGNGCINHAANALLMGMRYSPCTNYTDTASLMRPFLAHTGCLPINMKKHIPSWLAVNILL